MQTDEMYTRDPYAVAAEIQRTPGFGFGAGDGNVLHRHLEYASILSRIAASFIDGLITLFSVVLILVGLVIADRLTGGDPSTQSKTANLLILLAAYLAFLWLYYVGQETSTAQATLGKRLVGIKVATRTGGRISVLQSTFRLLVKMVPGANPFLGFISLIVNIICLVMNTAENRTVHDLIAGTVVISG